jgi:hypothetical protein
VFWDRSGSGTASGDRRRLLVSSVAVIIPSVIHQTNLASPFTPWRWRKPAA